MPSTLEFLVRHGYVVLFVWVGLDQFGVPAPALPVLLAAGALARAGRLNPVGVLLVSILASLVADIAWYWIGQVRGGSVLNWLCRISLEPDSCVRQTEDFFARHGARSLLVAKFIPGLSTVTPPLAGIFRMRLGRFLVYDALGALLWTGSLAGLGYIFSSQLERVADRALHLGMGLVILLAVAFSIYILIKYLERRRFLADLRVARISPSELKEKLDLGEEIQIVDLRHNSDFDANPIMIPGAVHLDPTNIEHNSDGIALDRDVILYCT